MYRFLRSIPGCEHLEISFVANECGIRESWRIQGEKRIDPESYSSGKRWEDAVCYSFYPIDLHQSEDTGIDKRPLSPGSFLTIPYGSLIPQGSEHVLAAGRCIPGIGRPIRPTGCRPPAWPSDRPRGRLPHSPRHNPDQSRTSS